MWRLGALCAVLLIASAACGDVIHLAGGGKLEGSLTELELSAQGVLSKLKAADVACVNLHDEGQDVVTLKSGESRKGVVESVRVRTIGGEFTLTRNKLQAVDLSISDQDRLSRECEKRRNAIRLDDVEGHYALAQWCRQNGLTSEMRLELQNCIVAAPNDPRLPNWHKMAGHVLYEGKWMTPEEKQSAFVADMTAKGLVEYNGKWIPQAEFDQIKAVAEKIKQKIEAAEKAVKTQSEAESARIQKDHTTKLATLDAQAKKLEDDFQKFDRQQQDEQRRARGPAADEHLAKAKELGRQKAGAAEQLKNVNQKKSDLLAATKRAEDRQKAERARKLRALDELKTKLADKLRTQKTLTDAEIDDAIEKAIGKA
jgi:hypothetical protein